MAFKYIELFAGIGGFRSALDPLGGECVFASEIDPFATRAYKALYNGAPELRGDITQIDAEDIPDHDVLVGGFPCQAFSVAGQRKGFEDARGTLFFEIARIASVKKPRLMLLENVKGLLSHDGGKTFETMCAILNNIGYAIDFAVLNSKYFGVPQNRERVFIVCDRYAEHAEWNVTGTDVVAKAKRRIAELGVRTFNFDWPQNNEVTTRLRDILESNVPEKYYLSDEKTAKLIAQLEQRASVTDEITCFNPRNTEDGTQTRMQDRVYDANGVLVALTAGFSERMNIVEDIEIVGRLDTLNGNDICKRVYSADAISPTIPTGSSGNTTPKIAEPQEINEGEGLTYALTSSYGHKTQLTERTLGKKRLTYVKEPEPVTVQMNRVYSVDGVAPTITVVSGGGREQKIAEPQLEQYTDGSGISYTVDANYAKGTSPGDIGKGRRTHVIEPYTVIQKTHSACTTIKHDETGTLQAARLDKVPQVVEEVRPVLTPDIEEKHQNGRRFKDDGEESFTLTARDKHGVAIGKYPHYRIRKLTPRECWRLQGFTDAQHDTVAAAGVSDSQRYKQAGNAVTVNVIRAIGERLIPLLNENKTGVLR